MESLALFIANDNFNRKTEEDNYNLRHLNVSNSYYNKLFMRSQILIKFNDKFIGMMDMSIKTNKFKHPDNKLTIELYLRIKSFYDDFDHDHLKGLLNHLHLDHSENLVIPKLSHDHRKFIRIQFINYISMDDFDSITVYNSYEEMKKTTSSDDLYRNEIDLKQKQDLLFSFFRNPSYEFENFFVFRMEECFEDVFLKDRYSEPDPDNYMKSVLLYPLLKLISPEIRKYGDHIYQFVRDLVLAYRRYFRHQSFSEEDRFVKNFYDWKNNQHWIEKENHINDENFQYLLNVLLWMDEYLEDERKEVLGY